LSPTNRLPHDCRFLFTDTATTEIYTLSLHDALPIWEVLEERLGHARGRGAGLIRIGAAHAAALRAAFPHGGVVAAAAQLDPQLGDRKSTRLNSSHVEISYAVFCLKKKKTRYRWRCPS